MKQVYLLLAVAVCCILESRAQTTFGAFQNNDFLNVANWTNGLPASGNPALIPGNTVAILQSANYTANFDLESYGTLTLKGDVTFSGKISNSGTIIPEKNVTCNALVQNNGSITIPAGTVFQCNNSFTNTGALHIQGHLRLNGTASELRGNVQNKGTLTLANGTTIINTLLLNEGNFSVGQNATADVIFGAQLHNAVNASVQLLGVLKNQGQTLNNGTFENRGTINNGATLENLPQGRLTNIGLINGGGQLLNKGTFNNEGAIKVDILFQNESALTNSGSIESKGQLVNETKGVLSNVQGGKITVATGSTLANKGEFRNRGTVRITGVLNNLAHFLNQDSLVNTFFGEIYNNWHLVNRGVVINNEKIFNNDIFENFTHCYNNNGAQLVNNDTLYNRAGAFIYNRYEITNNEVWINEGIYNNYLRTINTDRLYNTCQINNSGDFFNEPLGCVYNHLITENLPGGIWINRGTWFNEPNGTIFNRKCAEIILHFTLVNKNVINNAGILYNRERIQGGTFNDNNGIYLDINQPIAPVLCTAATIGLNPLGIIKAYGATVSPKLDSCNTFILQLNGQDTLVFNCSQIGTHPVTFTLSDHLGNTQTCSTTITVIDNLGPKLSGCPKDTTILAFTNSGAIHRWTPPTASDNCGKVVSLTSNYKPGDLFLIGITEVIFTATDDKNNPGDCKFKITVQSGCNKTGLMVVGNTTLSTADRLLKDRMEGLGFQVKVVQDRAVQAIDANGAAFVFISPSVVAGNLGERLTHVAVPIINAEAHLLDDLKMTGNCLNVDFGTTSTRQICLINDRSPLAAGFKNGLLSVYTSTREVAWGKAPSNANRVANLPWSASQYVLFSFDKGMRMQGLFNAPETRIAFFLGNETSVFLTKDGWDLFDATIQSVAKGCQVDPCTATGIVMGEEWYNISGYDLASIPVTRPADRVRSLNALEIPVNQNDRYGARIRGTVCAPATGFFTFFIASDDKGELYLSKDANPANKTRIAFVPEWSNSREWFKYPQQCSSPIFLVKGQSYYLEALVKEHEGGDNLAIGWRTPNDPNNVVVVPASVFSAPQELEPTPVCTASGMMTREVWINVPGTSLDQIPVQTTPYLRQTITSTQAPSDAFDRYGQRLRGYICPPATGQYSFWISSDDHSELYLSTNEDPANKTKIAFVNGWTSPGNFHAQANQKSVNIHLKAGHKYYIEILHVDQGGPDHLSIGWALPNGTTQVPIPGSVLSPISGLNDIVPPVQCAATGTILRETWTNIWGSALACIPFSQNAQIRDHLTCFEFEPTGRDNFGARVSGFICPPQTGFYTFWFASDDNGALFLSRDENPRNKCRIAYVPDYTDFRQFNKYACQRSVRIWLEAGKKYYIEGQVKEAWGGDHMSAAWQLPDGTFQSPIAGAHLSPWTGAAGAREAVLGLDAALNTYMVDLEWVANNDDQAAEYIVERTTDRNAPYESIGTVAAFQQNGYVRYSFTDETAPKGTVYYRVIQKLSDSTERLSEIRTVELSVDLQSVTAFPNPTTGEINITLGTYEGRAVTLILTNSLGQIIQTQVIERATKMPYTLDISYLHDGNYRVLVQPESSKALSIPVILTRP